MVRQNRFAGAMVELNKSDRDALALFWGGVVGKVEPTHVVDGGYMWRLLNGCM